MAMGFVSPLAMPQMAVSNAVGGREMAPGRALRHAAAGAAPSSQSKSGGAQGLALLAGLGAVGAAALRRGNRARQIARRAEAEAEAEEPVGATYKPEDWIKRVKIIEGDRAVFDVTIPLPLGLVPRDFPNRPGVGVAKINKDSNTDKLNKAVIMEGAPGMFVLEGDEVVAVNGVNVEGQSLEKVAPLVKDATGDSITLTLCRAYLAAPVKVVFIPSGQNAVMKRGVEISQAANVGVAEVSYSCKEGWCKACWHTDPMFGIVYRACAAVSKKRPPPKNPRNVPKEWNSIVPLWLIQWKDRMELSPFAKQAGKAAATKAKREEA